MTKEGVGFYFDVRERKSKLKLFWKVGWFLFQLFDGNELEKENKQTNDWNL